MKPRHKVYLRLNLVSLFFIVVSFISVTLAWFAYSGLVHVNTEVGVKAWYIEFEKDGKVVSKDIVISLEDIYPGMDTVNENVNIKNLGDSDAQVKYSIESARILNNAQDNYVVDGTTTTSEYVEDAVSHDYPFHININLAKGYVLSKGTNSSFGVSVSWPLDSGDDALDSLWGTDAYAFQQSEESKKAADPNYQTRPSIEIVISLTAEQYLEADTTSDTRYNMGDTVLFDVANNHVCGEVGSTCLKTYIMDVNNKLSDTTVMLLPDPNNTYLSGTYGNYSSLLATETASWAANARPLLVDDLLKIVSTDVIHSYFVKSGVSNSIIGNLNYANRMNTEITRATSYNGHYEFVNTKYSYLTSSNCYWTGSEYNSSNGFALKAIDENSSKIYGEAKTSSCNVIPVIIANKSNL